VFDTVLGLPVHALVIHGVVVLLPLMAMITAAVAVVPRWRGPAAWPVAVIDAGMVAMTFVARQSGEALQTRLGDRIAQAHAALGRNLIFFALAMLLASLVVAVTRRSQRAPLGAVLAVVTGVLVVWWTVRVGHSGSDAVWRDIVTNTNQVTRTNEQ
jgi:Ca2+/Na+ antiporter